jgi:hypothetical protein
MWLNKSLRTPFGKITVQNVPHAKLRERPLRDGQGLEYAAPKAGGKR